MQNKANLLNVQMNTTFLLTKHYENIRLCRRGEKQTQSKPNKLETNLSLREPRFDFRRAGQKSYEGADRLGIDN
jgi:hypothetical protein